jgi:hypothetical protein
MPIAHFDPVSGVFATTAVARPTLLGSRLPGRDPRSRKLQYAFAVATGRTMFVFGLIAFIYVYLTVYVFEAASVDWWVHHWLPRLRWMSSRPSASSSP